MKKIFSLLLALVLVLGSFSSAFAGENHLFSFSSEELENLLQKKEQELKLFKKKYIFSEINSN